MLISIITSRVLSPQYLVWICGLIALCLALTPLPRGGTVLAGPCWLLIATISITQVEFPLLFSRLLKGNTTAAVILACRNGMLVIATVWAGYLLWRAYVVPEHQADLVTADVGRTDAAVEETAERTHIGVAAETADAPAEGNLEDNHSPELGNVDESSSGNSTPTAEPKKDVGIGASNPATAASALDRDNRFSSRPAPQSC